MPEIRSFSYGVDRLLEAIQPYGGYEKISFPHNITEGAARRSPGETLHAWFERLVNDFCDGDPKRVAIEDNIAVFMRLLWNSNTQLIHANIQTLVAANDLEDYYLGSSCEAAYLRLDFDYNTLGEPFSHPLAHIHLEGGLSPRFALDGGNSGNIIVDYLEFIYRHYVPVKWRSWAEREWHNHFPPGSDDEDDPFPAIMAAFASSQFEILRNYSRELELLKQMLRRRKDELLALQMEGSDRLILEYPAAR